MGCQNKMTQETAAELQPGGALTRAELHRLVAFAGLADMWCSRTSRLVSHRHIEPFTFSTGSIGCLLRAAKTGDMM